VKGSAAPAPGANTRKASDVAASFVIEERLLRCRSSDKRAEESKVLIIQRYPMESSTNPKIQTA
jgi:hypothetical protein